MFLYKFLAARGTARISINHQFSQSPGALTILGGILWGGPPLAAWGVVSPPWITFHRETCRDPHTHSLDGFQWLGRDVTDAIISSAKEAKQKIYETGKPVYVDLYGLDDDMSREEFV